MSTKTKKVSIVSTETTDNENKSMDLFETNNANDVINIASASPPLTNDVISLEESIANEMRLRGLKETSAEMILREKEYSQSVYNYDINKYNNGYQDDKSKEDVFKTNLIPTENYLSAQIDSADDKSPMSDEYENEDRLFRRSDFQNKEFDAIQDSYLSPQDHVSEKFESLISGQEFITTSDNDGKVSSLSDILTQDETEYEDIKTHMEVIQQTLTMSKTDNITNLNTDETNEQIVDLLTDTQSNTKHKPDITQIRLDLTPDVVNFKTKKFFETSENDAILSQIFSQTISSAGATPTDDLSPASPRIVIDSPSEEEDLKLLTKRGRPAFLSEETDQKETLSPTGDFNRDRNVVRFDESTNENDVFFVDTSKNDLIQDEITQNEEGPISWITVEQATAPELNENEFMNETNGYLLTNNADKTESHEGSLTESQIQDDILDKSLEIEDYVLKTEEILDQNKDTSLSEDMQCSRSFDENLEGFDEDTAIIDEILHSSSSFGMRDINRLEDLVSDMSQVIDQNLGTIDTAVCSNQTRVRNTNTNVIDVVNKCALDRLVQMESTESISTTQTQSVVTKTSTKISTESKKTTSADEIISTSVVKNGEHVSTQSGAAVVTKKKKKSKKDKVDEKENISVNTTNSNIAAKAKMSPAVSVAANSNLNSKTVKSTASLGRPVPSDLPRYEDDLSNINVKCLKQAYCSKNQGDTTKSNSKTKLGDSKKHQPLVINTGVSIKQLCHSFGDLTSLSDDVRNQTTTTMVGGCLATKTNATKSTNGLSQPSQAKNNTTIANGKGSANSRMFDKSSFNKFDALQKKSLEHSKSGHDLKSPDGVNGTATSPDVNSVEKRCRLCTKPVFQMELIKAEKHFYHKNCFRCKDCNKQLTVDTYESHESQLYCKPHFRALFAPKVIEDDQPKMPRKHEMIIRENQPMELPPDVVRASDKPDLCLELSELTQLNVKSRYQMFEQQNQQQNVSEQQQQESITVKRSPSILSKLAKFQRKGMDIGISDEALQNSGIAYEESSEEEQSDSDVDGDEIGPDGEDLVLVRARKRAARERPVSFANMSDIKSKFEVNASSHVTSGKEERREERKQEIQNIRSRLFMGKQAKIKEMYQQAVLESEQGITSSKKPPVVETCDKAKSIKERFEKGEVFNNQNLGDDENEQGGLRNKEQEDMSVFDAGICKKSRSMFLELDANISRQGGQNISPSPSPRTPQEGKKQQVIFPSPSTIATGDVIKSSTRVDDVIVETAEISSKFRFFETYKPPETERRQFRITPPREGLETSASPERELYRDPEIIRADNSVSGEDPEIAEKSHTATKMLNIFRQMEEQRETMPQGPKPLKRFTPPPEDLNGKFSNGNFSDNLTRGTSDTNVDPSSDNSAITDNSSSEGEDELDDGPVSTKQCEDEALIQARNEARAKQLRAKFEKWETNEIKREQNNSSINLHEECNVEDSQLESAKSLRDRFESMREMTNQMNKSPRVKVNRFV